MTKLYKQTNHGLLYHEAWSGDDCIVEHWGTVGERGETKEHELCGRSPQSAVEVVLAAARAAGFREIDEDELCVLMIEYVIDGMGSPKDAAKRHALEERMGETLGWTGLGYCDGGSIGSGTMEVCCFVVEPDIARRVIAADLANTEFSDYARIFDENAD